MSKGSLEELNYRSGRPETAREVIIIGEGPEDRDTNIKPQNILIRLKALCQERGK